MLYKTATLALLMCLSASADVIVLKDGKTVEWRSLTAVNDGYEVVTPKGEKLSIKKADIDRIVIEEEKGVALTGATFTFEKKKSTTIDLLPKVILKGEETIGNWKFTGGQLTAGASGAERPRTPLDFVPPEEYDLTLTLEAKDQVSQLAVGLVGGGNQVAYHFDAFGGTQSCLALIGGANGEVVPGRVFQPGKPKTVKFMVRKEALIVQVEGKDFWSWKADWKRVSLHPSVAIRPKDKLFLVICDGTWKISAMTLTQPK
jgi:hypothetical protein